MLAQELLVLGIKLAIGATVRVEEEAPGGQRFGPLLLVDEVLDAILARPAVPEEPSHGGVLPVAAVVGGADLRAHINLQKGQGLDAIRS